MRELFRTDEGMVAWRSPSTDAQSRRLLGALVQPQPENHLKLVLGAEGEILLESLIRRGWVAWRPLAPEEPAQAQGSPGDPPPAQPPPTQSEPSEQALPPAEPPPTTPLPAPSAPSAVDLPPMKVPTLPSKEEIDSSLDEFFRKMGM